MINNHMSIKEILASKKVETPKAQFTKAEWAVMTREYKNSIDEHQKRAVADFTNNVVTPWREAIDQAQSLRDAGKADLVAQVTDAIKETPASSRVMHPQISSNVLRLPHMLPSGCIGTWILEPPYDQGFPIPVGEEKTTDTIAPGGGPGIFKATSVLSKPDQGILSLGLGVGRFFNDVYPAPLEDKFGDGNEVEANICHFMTFPGLVTKPIRVNVSVGINAPLARTHRIPTTSETATIEDGPVWALANAYLTLFGYPTVGDVQRTTAKRFCVQMWTEMLGCFFCEDEEEFDISDSLVLAEGAAGLGIIVEVRLTAFLTGRLDDLTSGFMGAGFRLPSPETHGIWLADTGGGAIRIPRINLTFCPTL